ncbi:MAG: dipeptidase [Myxococcota bacterium]
MRKGYCIVGLIVLLLARAASLSAEEEKQAPPFSHDDIASGSVIIDLHSDTIFRISHAIDVKKTPPLSLMSEDLEVSIPHLRAAGVKAQFFALWVSLKKGEKAEKGAEKKRANKLLEVFNKLLNEHSSYIAFAGSYKEVEKNISEGKISALLAIEDGAALGDDIKNVDYFHKRGVRYITLTWMNTNLIGDSSTDAERYGGLSEFGKKVIGRMNELGMIIDVSHASDETVMDALKISKDPIIASHSNCRALHPIKRNLNDELIKRICEKGGVIGVNFHSDYLRKKGETASVKDVAQHIEHIKKTGGVDCVALGSDFDGYIKTPEGLKNISELYALTEELKSRGYSREEIEKIYGGNFIRVLKRTVDSKQNE